MVCPELAVMVPLDALVLMHCMLGPQVWPEEQQPPPREAGQEMKGEQLELETVAPGRVTVVVLVK
jgi:hypothetical protein